MENKKLLIQKTIIKIILNHEEHVEDNIIKSPLSFYPIKHGLGYEYFMAMKKNKDKVAQYIVDSDETDTYGSLLQRSIRTALKLKSKELSENDIVCLCTNNHLNSCVPFISCLFLNVKVASLDPSLSLADTIHLIKQVKPKIFFVVPNAIELIEKTLIETNQEAADIVVFGESDKYEQFSDYLEPNDEEDEFQPEHVANIYETAMIFFSSGTTGFPKGICKHHYAIGNQSLVLLNSGAVTSVSLSYSSLYWISAVLILGANIFSGTARVICSKFDASQIWRILEKYKVSFLFLAPSQVVEMYKVGRPETIDTTNLLCLFIGGAYISENQLKALRDILPGTYVCQIYGQTEIAGILSCFNLKDVQDTLLLHYKPNSAGRPVPGINYKVVDPETEKICGLNERGELRVKSKFVMNGYFNMDSSETFDEDGWLKTGDVVYLDEDHCIYVVDRIKEMLKYKSWHVAPTMLEKVIENHPAVKQVVVIGIPHEEDGDHPMALIVLHDGFMETTTQDIEIYANERLDERQQLRGGVKFIDSIPLTATGKVRRKYVRDMVIEGKL